MLSMIIQCKSVGYFLILNKIVLKTIQNLNVIINLQSLFYLQLATDTLQLVTEMHHLAVRYIEFVASDHYSSPHDSWTPIPQNR